MTVYFGEFKDWADVANNFHHCNRTHTDEPLQEPQRVVFAAYEAEGYEGDAVVVYEQDGKLYLVTGGHCSCYGLEGQWEPEETTRDVLLVKARAELSSGYPYGALGKYGNELIAAIS